MDRKLARKNIRSGLIAGAACLIMFGITFLAAAELGDTLVAKAVERQRAGSTGVYDVTVTRDEGFVIAEFRGISRIVEGEWVPGAKLRGARGAKP